MSDNCTASANLVETAVAAGHLRTTKTTLRSRVQDIENHSVGKPTEDIIQEDENWLRADKKCSGGKTRFILLQSDEHVLTSSFRSHHMQTIFFLLVKPIDFCSQKSKTTGNNKSSAQLLRRSIANNSAIATLSAVTPEGLLFVSIV